MIKTIRRPHAGFTLIELLTVIAIIGILASIIIPTVGKVQQTARRTADASNLRQIGQASLIFAQGNKDQLPSNSLGTGTSFGQNVSSGGSAATTKTVAAALALGGGLDSAKMWVSRADETTSKENENANVAIILNQAKTATDESFNNANLAFGYVVGLNTNYSANTPVGFTRGIVRSTNGKWSEDYGAYKSDGGHIVFIGGNVSLYKNLGGSDASGELVNSNGKTTNNIRNTIKSTKTSVRFIEEDNTGAQSVSLQPTGS